MVKNKDVVNDFVNFADKPRTAGHLFIINDVLFSYGHHFPLSIRLKDKWLINSDKYSRTTSRHQSLIKNALNSDNIVLMNTEELNNILKLEGKDFKFLTFDDIQKLKIARKLNTR